MRLTNTLINDILKESKERRIFYVYQTGNLEVERLNRFSLDPLGLPFLLEENMPKGVYKRPPAMFDRKAYMNIYRKLHRERENAYRKCYRKTATYQAYHKFYIQSDVYKNYQKQYRKTLKSKLYDKYYRESLAGKACSKRYNDSPNGRFKRNSWWKTPKGKIFRKLCNAKYRFMTKDLTSEIIQQVYEDNIKRYSTLTCYLCVKPVPFGKDHLEHKIPLSRGGANSKENLDIACENCNYKKGTKTEEEYRKAIL